MPDLRPSTVAQLETLAADYRAADKVLAKARAKLVARMVKASESEGATPADLGRIVGVHRHTASVWLGRRAWRK